MPREDDFFRIVATEETHSDPATLDASALMSRRTRASKEGHETRVSDEGTLSSNAFHSTTHRIAW
ncbi:hypothetical protein [Ferrimicrobium sp.]|uniref:hypothetical protein n=1 Tax=Ferrimicrobium sp. TaxID=2926050 RepID=UPI002607562B|nr:hypothetical protein [Ferrimicrobium sp.]